MLPESAHQRRWRFLGTLRTGFASPEVCEERATEAVLERTDDSLATIIGTEEGDELDECVRAICACDRLLVASYGFCLVVFEVMDAPGRASTGEVGGAPQRGRGRTRCGMIDEGMRACLDTMFAVIHELAFVHGPIRGNAFGTVPTESFLSCWRGVAHWDYHFRNRMARMQVGPLMTWLRAFVGLNPSLEEGARRQRPRGRHSGALASRSFAVPMEQIMSGYIIRAYTYLYTIPSYQTPRRGVNLAFSYLQHHLPPTSDP